MQDLRFQPLGKQTPHPDCFHPLLSGALFSLLPLGPACSSPSLPCLSRGRALLSCLLFHFSAMQPILQGTRSKAYVPISQKGNPRPREAEWPAPGHRGDRYLSEDCGPGLMTRSQCFVPVSWFQGPWAQYGREKGFLGSHEACRGFVRSSGGSFPSLFWGL